MEIWGYPVPRRGALLPGAAGSGPLAPPFMAQLGGFCRRQWADSLAT